MCSDIKRKSLLGVFMLLGLFMEESIPHVLFLVAVEVGVTVFLRFWFCLWVISL